MESKDLSGIGDLELSVIQEMYRNKYFEIGPDAQLMEWIEQVHNEIEKREKSKQAAHEKQD